ncbi:MAG: hypothetical protein AAGH70_11865, partial [Pseudomonadota bacterium]
MPRWPALGLASGLEADLYTRNIITRYRERPMAGHSKWANIQHRKGRQDKLRAKLFSRLSKEITVAAK